METKDKMLEGGVTAGQINQWKKLHGEVTMLTVPRDDKVTKAGKPVNTVTGYFKKPDLDLLSQVQASAHDKGNATRIMVQGCMLGGDKVDIMDNEEVLSSMFIELQKLFKIRTAAVKKL